MKRLQEILCAAMLAVLPAAQALAADSVAIKAENKLQLARANETIELTAKDLAGLNAKDLATIHVSEGGKDLLCQAVDSDGDYDADMVIFQSDFKAGESKTFTATAGAKWKYTKDQFKAYGRFNRERFDDFQWENDKIAHRTYGKALETWKKEPLTSSAIDVWVKNVPDMVQNEWYMVDDYHADQGHGADFYTAGPSRGNGGNGLWAADTLWGSKNFVESRVLANGPIRVMFELTYEAFDVNGAKVSEVKRIALDAGQFMDHYWSKYKPEGAGALETAIGIRKIDLSEHEMNKEHGWLATWMQLKGDKKNGSHLGEAIVVDPKSLVKDAEDKNNLLIVAKVPESNVAEYWAGNCWDKGGDFKSLDEWKKYVDEYAQGRVSPIAVSVEAAK